MIGSMGNRWVTATVMGTAGLFAVVFWLTDTGMALLMSNSGVLAAIVPEGNKFLMRVMCALVFAVAGGFAGAALQRSLDKKELALADLEESAQQYRSLLSSSFDTVLTLDEQFNIVDTSESARTLFQRSASKLSGANLNDLISGAEGLDATRDRPVADLLHEAMLAESGTMAVTVKVPQNRQFLAEIRITSVPNGGKCAYLLAIRETAAKVVADKTLRHSERRYKALFDNIPAGVFRSEPDGRLLDVNEGLVAMLGYGSADELLTVGNTNAFFVDHQERISLIAELDRNGEARNVEIQLQKKDGTSVIALANIGVVGHDNTSGVVYEGVLTDISDLVESREALLDSEEHFRAISEYAIDIISVISADGTIIYSSPSSTSLSSRPPVDQIGLPLLRTVHPDDIETVRKIIVDGFKRPGTPRHFTCRLFRQDGEMRVVDSVGTAYMTRKGELRAVIHSRDVTKRTKPSVETEVTPQNFSTPDAGPTGHGSVGYE